MDDWNFENLGLYSLAAIYGSFAFFSLFMASLIVKWLKPKKSMVIGSVFYVIWVASAMIPITFENFPWGIIYVLFILTGLLNGFGASLLWVGQGVYISWLSHHKSKNYGTFWSIFMGSQLLGNLIAAVIIGKIGLLPYFISITLIGMIGVYMF